METYFLIGRAGTPVPKEVVNADQAMFAEYKREHVGVGGATTAGIPAPPKHLKKFARLIK
jgi:hypothetical protein